jgi:transcriptional regulator with XRE-family HTH domain
MPKRAKGRYRIVGARTRRLRMAKGLKIEELADLVQVDKSALSSWERGDYLPRLDHRIKLANQLGVTLEHLLSEVDDGPQPTRAFLVDTIDDLPDLLAELLPATRCLRAIRIAAPYPTAAHVQTEFRHELADRLLAGTIEVQRVEIFFNLRRLQEALSNVLRYDNRNFHLKAYCPGVSEPPPAIGGYIFDDTHFLLGGYWNTLPPPHDRPGLCCIGEPFKTFFAAYWSEIWSRGTLLNISGRHDLSAIQQLAFSMGLAASAWPSFVDGARTFEVGDGAPPII